MINIKEDLNNDYIKLFGISTPGSKLIMQGDDIVRKSTSSRNLSSERRFLCASR